MKKMIALLLALTMLCALAACGGSGDNQESGNTPDNPVTDNTNTEPSGETSAEPGPQLSGDPVKIGHIADLTGVEAMTGEEAVRSLEFAKKMIEADGGIDGRPIEIIVGDAQSNPATAADVARKLVEEDKVAAILGPTQIGHKSTVAGYMADAGVPAIYYNGTPFGMVKGNEYVISAGGGTAQMPTVMADYLYKELGYRTINTITQDNTGGHNYMDPLIENFKALGGTVASAQYTPVPTPDFGAYLITLPDADCLVAWVSGSDAIALWTAWYDMGVCDRMPMYGSTHGGFTDYFICDSLMNSNPAVVDKMLEDTIVPIMYSYTAEHEENRAFVDAWVKEYGSVPPGTNLPGAAYSALLLLKTAIENIGGSTEPEALYEALQKAEITGAEGHLYFAQGMRVATKDVHVTKLIRTDEGTFNYEVVKTYTDVPANGLTVGG